MANQTLVGVLRYIRRLVVTTDGQEQSDRQLLQRFVAHKDEHAFAALLERHGPLVLGVCAHVLPGDLHAAEDAFQATFLVLARKAASLRRQASLGAWLYRVAVNLASDAQRSAARRRRNEKKAVIMAKRDAAAESDGRDLEPIIHEEVNRLPAKYRMPVVLCYMNGKTHAEAAQELRWPVGTVKGRLARARDLLRTRLARRGLALSTGSLTAVLSQTPLAAAVSTALMDSTLKAAVLFATGKTALLGLASVQAVTLAKGALKTMAATKLILVTLFMLTAGVLGTGGGMLVFRSHGEERGRPGDVLKAPAQPADELKIKIAADNDFGPEVKGLRAKVTLTKEKLEVGDAIKVKYVIKNVSREEQTIWHSGFWPNHLIVVKDVAGKEPALTELGQQGRQAFAPGGARRKNVAVKVAPGGEDAAYEQYDLTKIFDLTKLGRYTVRHIYEEKQGGWEGRLESNAAAFEIVAAKEDAKSMVEKDGVRFEILVPKRDWPIPEKKDGAKSAIQLGLRITNKTDKPFRFSRFDTIHPDMIGPDGKPLRRSGGRNGTKPAKETDSPLAKPGESVTFDIDAQLFWQDDKLCFGGSDGFGGIWGFAESFGPGRYQLRIWYTNDRNKAAWPGTVWTGEAKTPYVEVSLAPVVKEADGEAKKDDAIRDDLKALEGTWQLVAAEEGGKALPPGSFNSQWTFSGTTSYHKSGLRGSKGTITIDPTENPKWIDETKGLGAPVLTQGIYEVKGDTLRLFFAPPGEKRPTAFKTEEGKLGWLQTLSRVKPAPPGEDLALPKPLPDEVLRAWKDAGFKVGLVWVDRSGGIRFNTAKEEPGGEIPGFQPEKWRDGVLSKLPDPGMPFGLDIVGNKVTDVGLKELAGLKSLQMLNLGVTQVTDAGLKELAKLKNLQALSLYNTEVTDAGLKELAALKSLQSLKLGLTADRGAQVTDAGLKELGGVKSLQTLSLFNTKVTDAGLKELAGLKSLQSLGLGRTQVTDAGLKELAGLKSLQSLDLGRTQVTDAGLKELAGLESLQSLDLQSTQVTDAGLKELGGLKSLQSLNLGGTRVTDAGLKELGGLKSLQMLSLDVTPVTDAGLKELAGLKNLRTLSLFGTQVTGAGLKELAGLKSLQSLSLWYCPVTDAGLKELAGLKSLQSLKLAGTRLTDAGIKELAGMKNLRQLILYNTKVTDAGLKELAGLKSLRLLNLQETQVTAAGVAELQKALPGCKIDR